MNELYRTYEVLVQESVHPDDERRRRTRKDECYDDRVARMLRDTNDAFQDAVAYNVLALAAMAGNARDRNGNLLNPLWSYLCSPSMMQTTDGVVCRLAERYTSLAGLKTAGEFRQKALNLDQIAADCRADYETALARTYGVMERQGIKRNDKDEVTECASLNIFASNWASILCDPVGRTILPGLGIYDRLHAELKAKVHSDTELNDAIERAIAESETCHTRDFEESFEREVARLKTDNAQQKKRAARKASFSVL
ncbi:MAG: hypothetical protein ACLQVX_00575 [Limisphaerales bacterium]